MAQVGVMVANHENSGSGFNLLVVTRRRPVNYVANFGQWDPEFHNFAVRSQHLVTVANDRDLNLIHRSDTSIRMIVEVRRGELDPEFSLGIMNGGRFRWIIRSRQIPMEVADTALGQCRERGTAKACCEYKGETAIAMSRARGDWRQTQRWWQMQTNQRIMRR